MELDSFLASPRWDILQIIARQPASPIEIAAEIGTTVSFVSQQLKLLEAARIVTKKRTGLVEKGKPRTLFSLASEIAYIIPLSRDFNEKRTISLSAKRKATLKIWELEDLELQESVQRAFWLLSSHFDVISGVAVYTKSSQKKLIIIADNNSDIQKLKGVKRAGDELPLQVASSSSEFSKLESEFLAPIYDPQGIFENWTVLKGGLQKNE